MKEEIDKQNKLISEHTELWKDIEGYENIYMISTLGRIKSLRRKIILKSRKNKRGQEVITLSNKDRGKDYLVSRLVAKAFIPNPKNLPQVDHIIENYDKANNTIFNLQWINQRDNSNKFMKATGRNAILPGVKRNFNKYQCHIRINGKNTYVGSYNNPQEAHEIYKILSKNPERINEFRKIKPVKGVSKNKRSGKWIAYYNTNKKRIHLGTFDSEEEALEKRNQYVNIQNESN